VIILSQANAQDIAHFGHSLLNTYRGQLQSFEEASQVAVENIFDAFRQPNGEPVFALTRIYRLCTTAELTDGIRANLTKDSDYWLALMGTIGLEPAWCDRRHSRFHQAVPVGQNMSLMFQTMLTQIGVNVAELGMEKSVNTDSGGMAMTKIFHVYDALQSPAIPDKDEFVIPYNIQSVIGIGGRFLSGAFFVSVCFSQIPIRAAEAQLCVELVPYIATLLALYDNQGILWNS
jgi:hypothetical protein